MLLLISPAKTLDYTRPLPADLATRAPQQPRWAGQALELIKLLRQHDRAGIAALMDLSDALADLNVARCKAWRRSATPANSRPALLAFNGDVYEGLQAPTLRAEDIDWAEQHLLILSGLYGLLQPLDALQPYRLEMGTRLANALGPDLYAWWRERVSTDLKKRVRAHARATGAAQAVVLNLASQEYARVVDRAALGVPVVDVVFEDWHAGRWKIISFNAKRARGLMARHVIVNRLTRPDELGGFDAEGWVWARGESTALRLVFRRELQGGAGGPGLASGLGSTPP
jgi:cytoplasmic iron level regulating protein YaaA (DUF328/UPF0246 family)